MPMLTPQRDAGHLLVTVPIAANTAGLKSVNSDGINGGLACKRGSSRGQNEIEEDGSIATQRVKTKMPHSPQ